MIFSLVISLFLTISIELIVSLIIGIRGKENIKIVVLANTVTNPVVVFATIMLKLFFYNYIYIGVIILEILAVLVEFVLYTKYLKFDKFSPYTISIINNVISFSIGIIINNFI